MLWKRGPPPQASACTPGYYNNEGVTGANEGLYGRRSAARLAGVPHKTNPLRWFATLERRRLDGAALEPFDVS